MDREKRGRRERGREREKERERERERESGEMSHRPLSSSLLLGRFVSRAGTGWRKGDRGGTGCFGWEDAGGGGGGRLKSLTRPTSIQMELIWFTAGPRRSES